MEKYICSSCFYIYNPLSEYSDNGESLPWESLEESWTCPHCGENREAFTEYHESTQEITSLKVASDQEIVHTPFYEVRGDSVFVRVGTKDLAHPDDPEHFIAYIWTFDDEWHAIDLCIRPTEEVTRLSLEWIEDFEVRAVCNVHGAWKGFPVDNKL